MHLVFLEFFNRKVSLVNGNEIHKLAVLLDVHVRLLNRRL